MVISPEELEQVDKTLSVVIAIQDIKDAQDVKTLLEGKGFSKIYQFHIAFLTKNCGKNGLAAVIFQFFSPN